MTYCAPPRFTPAAPLRIPAAAALLAIAAACGQTDTVVDGIFTPELTGTATVPFSESNEVSLLADEGTACVIDSYEVRVRCVDGEGAVVGVFGREGEGPGEFGEPSRLARGEGGTVGVHDWGLGRFTVFEPSGAYVSEVSTAGVSFFTPLRSFGAVLSGVTANMMVVLGHDPSGSLMTRYDIDIASGEIVLEEASPPGPWDVECGEVPGGIPDRAGGWFFVACEGHLIFADDAGEATVVLAPTYVAELPDERDVARREELIRSLQAGRPAIQPVAGLLEDYRATPKNYFLSTGDQLVDAANRWWIATQRDTHEWSYLDVYENAEYVGSVKVRDRLRAFDLTGSTLVVLVDRRVGPDDTDGIPDRALDWYDIGDLPFGG